MKKVIILVSIIVTSTIICGSIVLALSQFNRHDAVELVYESTKRAAIEKCQAVGDPGTDCASIVLINVSASELGNDLSGTFYTYQLRIKPENDLKYQVLVSNDRVVSVNVASIE